MVRALVLAGVIVAARPVAADSLSVTVTTTPNGGQFAPQHVVAIWIEDSGGAFKKTIGRWAGARISHLVAWIAKSGQDADAVSGATIQNHTQPLTLTWNLKDRAGAIVPDGTYTVRMELADDNTSQPAQNHQGTFTFVKGPTTQTQTGLSNGGFVNATLTFTASSCNNGVLDPGEACDGNCPTSCAASSDACTPVALTGAAATCDAACTPQPITQCISGDGCCADGCTESNDSDCAGGGGTSDGSVLGGCASSSGAGWFVAFVALGLWSRRRRARQ